MPISDDELDSVRRRVNHMHMETVDVFRLIRENSENLFGQNYQQINSAIDEYLTDFIDNVGGSGERHPEQLIYETSAAQFQSAGFYGSQLDLKERQVSEANAGIRDGNVMGVRSLFRSPFKKWVDRINNFLSSLISATGAGESIKELKDCLRDELPDDD